MSDAVHGAASIAIGCCWGSFLVVWGVAAFHFGEGRAALRGGFFGYWFAALLFLGGLSLVVPAGFWAALTTASDAAPLAGALVGLAATAFAIWARLVLGAMWSASPRARDDHELARGGPYRLARHPIYTGILGMLVATALVSGGGRALLLVVGGALFVAARIRAEEALMVATFGDDYERFRAEVPRLVPSPRRLLSARRARPVG